MIMKRSFFTYPLLTFATLSTASLGFAQTSVEPIPANIDWAAAAEDQKKVTLSPAANAFVKGNSSSLDSVKFPVLLPDSPVLTQSPTFRSQGTAYAASYAFEGARLSVTGTSMLITQRRGNVPMAQAQGPSTSPRVFDPGEDGTDLAFTKYGASYVLRLSCKNTSDDRCLKPTFLNDIADRFLIVGGKK